jgi:hypothetical protein
MGTPIISGFSGSAAVSTAPVGVPPAERHLKQPQRTHRSQSKNNITSFPCVLCTALQSVSITPSREDFTSDSTDFSGTEGNEGNEGRTLRRCLRLLWKLFSDGGADGEFLIREIREIRGSIPLVASKVRGMIVKGMRKSILRFIPLTTIPLTALRPFQSGILYP